MEIKKFCIKRNYIWSDAETIIKSFLSTEEAEELLDQLNKDNPDSMSIRYWITKHNLKEGEPINIDYAFGDKRGHCPNCNQFLTPQHFYCYKCGLKINWN